MITAEKKTLTKYLGLGWLSCFGDAMYYIALVTYAATLDNSALGILIISISTTFPNIIDLILGTLADGSKAKLKQVIGSGYIRAVLFVAIGAVIWLTNSLWGIVLVGILNAISATAGSYAASLKSPFLKLLTTEDTVEQVIGLNSGIRETLDVIAGFIGVALLGILGIYYLAFFNAAIFIAVSIGFKLIHSKLKPLEETIEPPQMRNIKQVTGHMKESVKTLLGIKPLVRFLLVGAALNGILGASLVTLLISLTENPHLQLVNFEFSVSFAKGIAFAAGLLAAIFGPKYCEKIGTTVILVIELLVAIGFMICIGLGATWFAVGFISVGVFFATMFSIRLSSFFVKAIPLEMLGTLSAALGLFLSVLPLPLTIALNAIAAISLYAYSITGITLSLAALVITLFLKLDKINLHESLQALGKE